jgi:hypothetical protein
MSNTGYICGRRPGLWCRCCRAGHMGLMCDLLLTFLVMFSGSRPCIVIFCSMVMLGWTCGVLFFV